MAHQALVCVVPDGTSPTDGTLVRVAAQQTIEWPAGDGGTVTISCVGEDGEIFDLDGCTVTLVCRRAASDEAYVFAYIGTIDVPGQGEPAPGTASFAIDGADTEGMTAGLTYWFDIRLVDDSDNVYHIFPPSKWIPTVTIAKADEPEPPPEPAP